MTDYLKIAKSRGLDDFEMHEVRLGLQHGLTTTQIDLYAQSKYNSLQMKEIRLGLEHGLTNEQMSVFLNPAIEYDVMQHNRMKIEQGNVIDETKKTDLHNKKIVNIRNALIVIVLLMVALVGSFYGKTYYDMLQQDLYIQFSENVVIEYGHYFLPASYIENYPKSENVEIVFPDTVQLDRLGEYVFVYQIQNPIKSVSQELTVTCIDSIAPAITLNQYSVTLTKGNDVFIPEEYIVNASDNVDGDLTDLIRCDYEKKEKNQTVLYSVTDSSGNCAEVEFTLKWKDPPEPEVVYVEKPIYTSSSNGSNSSGATSSSSSASAANTGTGSNTSPEYIQQPSAQSHGTKTFMFADGYDLDSGYSACVVALNSIGYGSCTAIVGGDGLYIGYQLDY